MDVWPGDSLILEVIPEPSAVADGAESAADELGDGSGRAAAQSQASTSWESDVLATFEASLNTINVFFNHPDEGEAVYSVPAKRSASLASVKAAAVAALNGRRACEASGPGAGSEAGCRADSGAGSGAGSAGECLEACELHGRRGNARGAMFKDELKSLRALALVDGSVLWLGRGKPCKPSEFLLDFLLYDPTAKPPFAPLASLPVDESTRISALKVTLAEAVRAKLGGGLSPAASLAASPERDVDPRRLRLRDKKLTAVGAILRFSSRYPPNAPSHHPLPFPLSLPEFGILLL